MTLPARSADTLVRVLASNDLLGAVVPIDTSAGATGTIDGLAVLLSEARQGGPTIWLDSGDFTGGPLWSLGGGRGWDLVRDLPIAAAVIGNHELDEGPAALRRAQAALAFPLLCADLDIGLPAVSLVDTEGGRVGVIGLTHPNIDRLSDAPASQRRPNLVADLATQLRADGADWVVVLQHDGVTWWPHGRATRVRDRRIRQVAEGWQGLVDAVLGGHTLAAWSGAFGSIVAGQADAFATSALVIDLTPDGARMVGFADIPPAPPVTEFRSIAATRLLRAKNEIIGSIDASLTSRPAADRSRYLPDAIARSLRTAGEAEAALLFSSAIFTQSPVDGASSYLSAGDVSRLDLHRLFPFPDDGCSVIDLKPREFDTLVRHHDAQADPSNSSADDDWWNWSRTPCGFDAKKEEPRSVAVQNYALELVAEWLGRTPSVVHSFGARAAFEVAVA